MATLRKIVVNNQTWLWKYKFDDYDLQDDSYLRIKDADKKGQIIIWFRTGVWIDIGYCPFNKVLPATYLGENVTINLNQPRYIAQILAHVLQDFPEGGLTGTHCYQNGIEMLHELGYEFEYQKRLNQSE